MAKEKYATTERPTEPWLTSTYSSPQLSSKRKFSSSYQTTMENAEMDRLGPKSVFIGGGRNDDNVCPSAVSGMDYIRNPRLFKGMAFNLEERQGLGDDYEIIIIHIQSSV